MSPRLPFLAASTLVFALGLLFGTFPALAAPDREEIPAPERPTLEAPAPSTGSDGRQEAAWVGQKHPDIIPLPDRREAFLDADRPFAFPNPSSGVVTVQARSPLVSAEVYDLHGRCLAQLTTQGEAAVWDGRDGSGREVVPGVYFARVRTEDSAVRTVRIVRR